MKTPAKGRAGRSNSRPDSPRRQQRRPSDTGRFPGRDRGAEPGAGRPPGRENRPAQRRQPSGIRINGELVFGRNAVRESLRAGLRTPTRLFLADGVREDDRIAEIVSLARDADVLVDRIPRALLDDTARGGNHQGVGLETSAYPYVDLEDIVEAEGSVLVMDHLNDPQNFGTLMRAADASGVAGIVLPQDRSVEVTPAVVNASSGAVEHLRICKTPNLPRALDKLEQSGRWIVGLDEDETAHSIYESIIPTPVALVLGAEGGGISPIVRKRCQVIVSLPMFGNIDSLNAATAGSIVLFELLRRQLSDQAED